jgi:hypothetical protein
MCTIQGAYRTDCVCVLAAALVCAVVWCRVHPAAQRHWLWWPSGALWPVAGLHYGSRHEQTSSNVCQVRSVRGGMDWHQKYMHRASYSFISFHSWCSAQLVLRLRAAGRQPIHAHSVQVVSALQQMRVGWGLGGWVGGGHSSHNHGMWLDPTMDHGRSRPAATFARCTAWCCAIACRVLHA